MGVEGRGDAVGLVAALGEQCGAVEQPGRILRASARGGADELGPFEQLACHVLAGIDPLAQVATPGGERIDPGRDRVLVTAPLGNDEPASPTVVDQRGHRGAGVAGHVDIAVDERGAEHLVTFGEDIGGDDHLLADGPLDREPSTVDLGPDALNDDAGGGLFSLGTRLRTP